ncbi:MAG: C39 family peptidase [Deltaproteobacteria bacterium]|nr:C39 family peptidase [Deltaproteobacteria bacterium]
MPANAIGSDLQSVPYDPTDPTEGPCGADEGQTPTPPTTCSKPVDEAVDAEPDLSTCYAGGWESTQKPGTTFSDGQHPGGFPTSNGYPIYVQGDQPWRNQKLGDASSKTIFQAGCAMTATAMAMSGMTGKTITPSAVDDYMKTHDGMNGSSLDWDKIGGAANPPIHVDRKTLTSNEMLKSVLDHAPVVFAINHSGGSGDQHWLVATGVTADGTGITATDPATGKVLTFKPNADGSKFECANAPYPGGARDYVMTGSAAVFSRS